MVVAPMILLVTKGRSLTKAFAKVEGGIPYLFARPTYLSIAFSTNELEFPFQKTAH